MSRRLARPALAFALALSAVPLLERGDAAPPAQDSMRFRVTITNLTRGQIFAPALVASHSPAKALFEPGAPASPGLALLAEEGDSSMMLAALMNDPMVLDARSDTGPLMPGQSTAVVVAANPQHDRISVLGMLVSTNDAFYAVRRLEVSMHEPVGEYAAAWDAGSEANSEDCAWIPGPPCGNHAHDPAPAEGFVHVHPGVHGVALNGLSAAEHDWRNPVAAVRVERMKP